MSLPNKSSGSQLEMSAGKLHTFNHHTNIGKWHSDRLLIRYIPFPAISTLLKGCWKPKFLSPQPDPSWISPERRKCPQFSLWLRAHQKTMRQADRKTGQHVLGQFCTSFMISFKLLLDTKNKTSLSSEWNIIQDLMLPRTEIKVLFKITCTGNLNSRVLPLVSAPSTMLWSSLEIEWNPSTSVQLSTSLNILSGQRPRLSQGLAMRNNYLNYVGILYTSADQELPRGLSVKARRGRATKRHKHIVQNTH